MASSWRAGSCSRFVLDGRSRGCGRRSSPEVTLGGGRSATVAWPRTCARLAFRHGKGPPARGGPGRVPPIRMRRAVPDNRTAVSPFDRDRRVRSVAVECPVVEVAATVADAGAAGLGPSAHGYPFHVTL